MKSKHGRMLVWCRNYRSMGRREDNKRRRLTKHLRKFPADQCAVACMKRLGGKIPEASNAD